MIKCILIHYLFNHDFVLRNKTFGRGKKSADNKGATKRAQNKKGTGKKGAEQKGRRTKRARDHDVASPLHSRS